MNEAGDRQPPLHPFHEAALRLVGRMLAHGRTLNAPAASADPDLCVSGELVRRQRQVGRGRASADASGGIVLRAMARAEPAAKFALMSERNAAEMGADADHDQPLVMPGLD